MLRAVGIAGTNCWQNVEAELTLYPYDCVIIYNASSSNILVDEISITKL